MSKIPAEFEYSRTNLPSYGIFHLAVETMVKVKYETETHLYLTERTMDHRVPLKSLRYSDTKKCGSPMCAADHLWITVILLDNHVIIPPECILPEHLKNMCEIDEIQPRDKEREVGLRLVTTYNLESIQIEDLSVGTYEFFEKACLQLEKYELLKAHDADVRAKKRARK